MLYEDYLPSLIRFLRKLRSEILTLYHQDIIEVKTKSDDSPVTAADLISHSAILDFLKTLTPSIPVISEESEQRELEKQNINSDAKLFWCVDPLDGTRDFIAKTDDFSVNIALIENHIPVLGIIYVPVFDTHYFAIKNNGAFKQVGDNTPEKIHVGKLNSASPVIIASRRHANNEKLQRFFSQFERYERISRGSAIKFCLIAEGNADIYPRFGETFFWDTAAGQCIVEEAGGIVVDTNGNPLRYNATPPYLNPHFIAMGEGKNFTKWEKFL